MRKLTFTRKKAFVECGSRIMLAVECAEDKANVEIDGKPAFEMIIKNGETVEFEISEEQTMVYLSSSTMDTEFGIPAGTENVKLIAKPKFNPTQGNPFTITEEK